MSKKTDPVPEKTSLIGRRSESQQQKLISTLSHDLKTPLASVIGSLEIFERLKDNLSEEKRQALLDTALQESYRLNFLISNMMLMLRLENDMIKPHPDFCKIGPLLEGSIQRIQQHLKNCRIDIVRHEDPLRAQTDSTLLIQVIAILLDNAVKHSTEFPQIEIDYGRAAGTNQGFITIRDNGPGIDETQMELALAANSPYTGNDQQKAGIGLGLSVCCEIVQLLGGKIEAANHPKGGTLFTISFRID